MDSEALRDLFDQAPCGYLLAQANGRITLANQTLANWLGCHVEDLVGRRLQDLLNIAGKIYYETHFAPLLKMQGFFNEVALDLLCADGTVLPVLVNAAERSHDPGSDPFIRLTVFNASDRRRYERELLEARRAADRASEALRELNAKLEARVDDAVQKRLKAEEALRQAQKMEALGQLTGGIAHDFNNMLAVVIGGLNLIERRLARGDTNVGAFISGAIEGADKAAALTQRLLAFSRQQPLSPEVLNANQLVSGMSELLRRTLGEAIHLETVLAGGVWPIHADPNQLENAVLNLAVNARDAMPNGGRLTIETANTQLEDAYAAEQDVPAGPYVLIAVTDTGSGMPPEVVSRAFDAFFTTKAVGRGTGLGLSQAFGFVKQSGGHIKIDSEPNHGTTVMIYLPRFCGAENPSKRPLTQQVPLAAPSEMVLLVEDDDRVRELGAQMLRDLGYGVMEVQRAAAALQALDEHPEIGLLLTDVMMPDMNGRQLAAEARARRPDLKVLFTTGYTGHAMVQEGMLDPGVHLLAKPATLEQLASKVRQVLDETPHSSR